MEAETVTVERERGSVSERGIAGREQWEGTERESGQRAGKEGAVCVSPASAKLSPNKGRYAHAGEGRIGGRE